MFAVLRRGEKGGEEVWGGVGGGVTGSLQPGITAATSQFTAATTAASHARRGGRHAMGAASLGAYGEAEAELVVLLLVVQLPREQQVDLGEGCRLEVRVAGSR